MKTLDERNQDGELVKGFITDLWPERNRDYIICRTCRTKNKVDVNVPEKVVIAGVVGNAVSYNIINPKRACGCCGTNFTEGTVYLNNDVPAALLVSPVCGTEKINPAPFNAFVAMKVDTRGGAQIDGDVITDQPLVMRDNVTHNHYHN